MAVEYLWVQSISPFKTQVHAIREHIFKKVRMLGNPGLGLSLPGDNRLASYDTEAQRYYGKFGPGILDFTVSAGVSRAKRHFLMKSPWTCFPWMSFSTHGHAAVGFFNHFSMSLDGLLCSTISRYVQTLGTSASS